MADPPRASRLAPLAFVAGLTLMAVGLLVLSFAATDQGSTTFGDSGTSVQNGTATLAYAVPVGQGDETVLEGSYRFPEEGGQVMVLGCSDYALLRQGLAPTRPQVVSQGQSGTFSITDEPFGGFLDSAPFCPYRYVVFQWSAGDGDPEWNRPHVQLQLRSSLLTTSVGIAVVLTTLAGAAIALAGGMSWGRRLNQAFPAAGEEASTTEALLRILHQSGRWLEKTRRALVLAGILGIFLWYPILLPWAWNRLVGPQDDAGWVVPVGCLSLLVVLTVLWAREFLRLDRELVDWRRRLEGLRARENALLNEP